MSAKHFDDLFPPDEVSSGVQLVAQVSAVDDFLDGRGAGKRKRYKTIADKRWHNAVIETERMLTTGDFSEASALHSVTLFEKFHTEVYGVPPGELDAKQRFLAVLAAGRLLKSELNDDVDALLALVAWTWQQERSKIKWLDTTGGALHFRVTWQFQFSKRMVTDWRVKGHRAKATVSR